MAKEKKELAEENKELAEENTKLTIESKKNINALKDEQEKKIKTLEATIKQLQQQITPHDDRNSSENTKTIQQLRKQIAEKNEQEDKMNDELKTLRAQ